MATQGLIQRAFSGGELAPALHARADTIKYATGLRRCRNFLIKRGGGVTNRKGTRFVAECKTGSPSVELFPYFSERAGESILIECGVGYLRFFQNGIAVEVDTVAPWDAVTDYVPGDVASAGGVNYWAVIASTNQVPPAATFWAPLPGDLLEIPHDFGSDLPYWSQSGRVITLTHEDHPPMELTYRALALWSLTPIVTTPSIAPPSSVVLVGASALGLGVPIVGNSVANPTVVDTTPVAHGYLGGDSVIITGETGSTPTINGTWTVTPIDATHFSIPVNVTIAGTGGTATRVSVGVRHAGYVVTAAKIDTYEESIASGQVVLVGGVEPTMDNPNVITWALQADAAEYYVYSDPYGNGVYGYIGTALLGEFHDPGLTPDFDTTPPLAVTRFAATDDYPKVSGTYQQRRFFGYTKATPDGVDASRTGFPSNFSISSPLQDDDALRFRMAANQHNPVRHLVGLKQLVILTDTGEWSLVGILAPGNLPGDQQLWCGSAAVKPVVVGNAIIYLQARGSTMRDVQFDQQVEGLGGRDLTIFSSHLFDGRTIRAMDYAQTPDSIVWAVRDDGVLLGLTYLREQDEYGWHRHDTQGWFWDVCVVPEAAGDAVYVIVRRTIGGSTVRYIERLEAQAIEVFDRDVFFVDAGLSYAGTPVTNIAGLEHLEGEVVAVVGDGAVIFNGDPAAPQAAAFTVTGGTLPVALPGAYAHIHAGPPDSLRRARDPRPRRAGLGRARQAEAHRWAQRAPRCELARLPGGPGPGAPPPLRAAGLRAGE
jgi:hypothetical protein